MIICLALETAQTAAMDALSPIRSSATSRSFIDEHGRVRIFHGAARVEKNPPWYFKDLAEGSTEAEAMAALGFNVLRLGFSKYYHTPSSGAPTNASGSPFYNCAVTTRMRRVPRSVVGLQPRTRCVQQHLH